MLNLLGGLLGGGKGGALATISKVVDELHTSEEEKLDKKILMQRLQQKLAEKQLDVNAKEASHRSVFVAGWRPAIGWCGAGALFFAFILSPCIEWYAKFSGIDIVPPAIETGPLLAIVTSMLGVSGLKRAFAAAATVTARDDLQRIKGVGPFIAEKLNMLGITTFRQVANMTPELEDQVNTAIEFFPGRVRRDKWAAQAAKMADE